VLAKRTAPAEVSPVVHEGVSYRAGYVHDERGGRGTLEAVEVASGKPLWTVTVYEVHYQNGLETDVQDVYIRTLAIQDGCVVVTTERDVSYCVNPKTRRVTGLAAQGGERMQSYQAIRRSVEDAVEPLWRKVQPAVGTPPIGGPPRPPSVFWMPRASLVPMPHAWPPLPGSPLLDVDVFAAGRGSGLADAEHQSGAFARAVVNATTGEILRVEALAPALKEVGIQGVRPAPLNFWDGVDAGVEGLRAAVASGTMPAAAVAEAIRKGYGGFFGLNDVWKQQLLALHPEFMAWLSAS